MLLKIEKDKLFKIFKTAAQVVVEKKAGAHVAGSHVLLKVTEKKIYLVATDLEVELIVEQPLGLIETTGAAVVPFRKIIEICRAMNENVELNLSASSSEAYKLQIKAGKSFFSINCLESDAFPVLSQQMFSEEFAINIKLLKDLISKTSFAMGDDDSRHFLNGLSLEFCGGRTRAVAADGHRLMVWESTEKQHQEGVVDLGAEVKILIPRKSVFDILKLITEAPEQLFAKILVGEHHIRLIIDNITYTSKLLSGGFPPFKSLIPQNTKSILTADRELFKNCCQRAIALLGDKNQAIKLNFCAKTLEISGKNDIEDLVQESMTAMLQGPETEMCFNVRYLVDFLSNIDSPQVLFKAGEYNSGALMQGSDNQSYYIIMPMHI